MNATTTQSSGNYRDLYRYQYGYSYNPFVTTSISVSVDSERGRKIIKEHDDDDEIYYLLT